MGWTIKTSRRRDRMRHRPHLECLGDRCLLSAGLHGHTHLADALRGKGDRFVVRHHGNPAAVRERPAGTLISSAAAAYDSAIGASQVQSAYGVTGSGMTVAVIDTGVDYNNAGLGGGFGPGTKVIAGYDFSTGSHNPMATTSQHGTGVAGIIASDNASNPGVAPGADIVALKVTDASNTASLDSIAQALQWVVNNHAQYNITVVNLSLSDGQNYAHNWFATTGGTPEEVTNLIGQLRAMNIPVVVATGNNFDGHNQGEGFAAIVHGTISVTATNLNRQLLPDAQRLGSSIGGASATTIAAPGEGFTTLSGDNGTAGVDGTSFATPLVSGAIVLLQQIYHQRFGALPTVDQLQEWLQNGADPIQDSVTGITIGELDIPKAAALIPARAAEPGAVPAVHQRPGEHSLGRAGHEPAGRPDADGLHGDEHAGAGDLDFDADPRAAARRADPRPGASRPGAGQSALAPRPAGHAGDVVFQGVHRGASRLGRGRHDERVHAAR